MNKVYGKWFAVFVLMAFMGTSLSGFATAAKAENDKPEVKEETGTTSDLGGGDYVLVRFSNDAAFGVIYGTEQNPNSIIVVAMHVRYLGVAEVTDVNGASLGKTVPIPVLTVFTMKLEDIFEFNDTNGDGICNYRRWGFGLGYSDYFAHEPIYKMVSLSTAWTRGNITTEVDEVNKEKTWSFPLTAKNLPYRAVGNSSNIQDDVANEKLDKVEFTFHLSAKVVHYNNISVPSYKVTVEKGQNGPGGKGGNGGGYEIVKSEQVKDKTFSGDHGNYEVKFDHEFDGWDFDATNTDPHLLMEWHSVVGNLVPGKVAKWIDATFEKKVDKGANAKVHTYTGDMEINEDNSNNGTPFLESPKKVKTPHIDCGADWTKVGKLAWVSNVTVDGTEQQMYAQIQGGQKIDAPTAKGKYHGFAILAGFSYPGGEKIFHDPGISSSIPINIEFTAARNLRGVALITLGAVIGLVAVAGVAYSMKKKGKEEQGYYNGAYDTENREEKGHEDWDRYYRK